MGAARIKDHVMKYLADRPGLVLWRHDIATDLKFTDEQVTSAVRSIQRSDGAGKDHIVVVESGRAWRWSPTPSRPATPAATVFELLTTVQDGRSLVKGDDGRVYWLTEV